MAKRGHSKRDKGNFVSEWFGHRVHPRVATTGAALQDQQTRRCPFLSEVTFEKQKCIKPATASGICTISAASNGPRQDWLVCPYRAFDHGLLENAVARLFSLPADSSPLLRPAPTLENADVRNELAKQVSSGGASFVYLTDKLGGEIQLRATERSPQMAFDVTIVELVNGNDGLALGRYGFLEIQTMDFHGSYKHAVKDLEDALRLHKKKFHEVLDGHPEWLSKKVEGPNIANVFKRTFYQMVLKFQLGGHGACVGCVMAIPRSVWDSWQRHLGGPELVRQDDGTFTLLSKKRPAIAPAWIYVFDIDQETDTSPAPVLLDTVIATDAETIAQCALQSAAQAVLAEGGSADRLLASIHQRLLGWWPELLLPLHDG